jgi:hypothetical protein
MNELSIGFSQASDAKVAQKAAHVYTSLTSLPGITYFPTTTPTMAVFQTAVTEFQDALSLEATSSSIALRKEKRAEVILLLKKLAAHLELTADGDLVKLAATGFDLKAKATRSVGPLPAPQNLRVKPTGISGEALCKVSAQPKADTYEGQYTQNPTSGSWTPITPTTNSQNILFTGLDRGKDYYFRVRAIGANGPSGWSDVATMMVV